MVRDTAQPPAQQRQSGQQPGESQQVGRSTGGAGTVGRGSPSRVDAYREMINWRESAVIGVLAWLVGFVLTYIPLWWFDFAEAFEASTHDIAIWVYLEGVGNTAGDDFLITPFAYQGVVESDAFGVGVFFHMLLPAVLLLIFGHILAGRHIKQGRTNRPLETIVATITLALWVTLLFFLAALVVSENGADITVAEVLLMTLLYSVVFSAIGGTIRSRSGIASAGGLLGGIAAFFVGIALWYLIEDPLDPAGFSDLEGALAHFELLNLFVFDHGLDPGEFLPVVVVLLVMLLVGVGIGYVYKRTDPVVGLGDGARVGAGYMLPVSIVVIGYLGAWVRELESQPGRWPSEVVPEISATVGIMPRSILLAGIVFPVAFAAIGGAVGALAYKMQHDAERSPSHATRHRHQQPQSKDEEQPLRQDDTQPQYARQEDEEPSATAESAVDSTAAGSVGAASDTAAESPGEEETVESPDEEQRPESEPESEASRKELSVSDIVGGTSEDAPDGDESDDASPDQATNLSDEDSTESEREESAERETAERPDEETAADESAESSGTDRDSR